MIWANWHDFFAMGGYGLYVWGSVIVFIVVVAGEVILLSQRGKSIRTQLASARAFDAQNKGNKR